MKEILASITTMLMCMVATTGFAQLTSAKTLGLTGQAEEMYERVIATNPYSPANIAVGDSLIMLSHNGSDVPTFLGGQLLKAYPAFAQGDMATSDSLLDIVLDRTRDDYKLLFYNTYQLKATLHMAINDYHGTLKMAQDMSRASQQDNDPMGKFASYYTMGTSFVMRDNPRLAYMYFNQAKEVAEENNLTEKLWTAYFQLANCFSAMKNDSKAIEYVGKARDAARQQGSQAIENRIEIASLIITPNLYTKEEYKKKYNELANTPQFLTLAAGDDYALARSTYQAFCGNKKEALDLCDSISTGVNRLNQREFIFSLFDMWKEAYDSRFEADMVHDSLQAVILNEDLAAMDAEMNNAELRHEKDQLEARNKMTLTMGAFLFVLLVLGFFLFQYHQKQKQMKKQKEYLEAEVKRQVAELEQKSKIIEQNNKDITDSIQYAQRIQHAILPDLTEYAKYDIQGAFTFFVPYHIVSGDFYWANRKGNKLMFACADCTGHGVPGAFMSMIGTTILNDICSGDSDKNPADVLEMMDAELLKVLSQNNTTEVQDGMDMTFAIYDSERHRLSIAAARRPAYIFHNGQLNEIKGTKRSIGEHDDSYRKNAFEVNEVDVEPGDTLYICSDGIADQFGGQNEFGPRGKRLKSGGLKKILETIYPMDIEKQRDAIETLYQEWRGTCAQVDDVSLLGIRF